ncbi:MAG: glycosyltransferase [Candidatus Bathyarchaeia archaeon]
MSSPPLARIRKQDRPLKVLLLTWEYPPRIVGRVAGYVYSLAQGLAGRGLDVTVIHPSDGDGEKMDGAVRVLMAGHPIKHHASILNYIWSLSVTLVRRSADFFHSMNGEGLNVIHAHDWTSCLPALYLKWSFNLPTVLTVYSTESIRGGMGNLLGHGISEVERFCLKYADIILAGDDDVASRIKVDYGILCEKILPARLGSSDVDTAINAYEKVKV